jgi:hypothetical protein
MTVLEGMVGNLDVIESCSEHARSTQRDFCANHHALHVTILLSLLLSFCPYSLQIPLILRRRTMTATDGVDAYAERVARLLSPVINLCQRCLCTSALNRGGLCESAKECYVWRYYSGKRDLVDY